MSESQGRSLTSKHQRADILLVERGLATSRSHAQALIMSGKALQNDIPIAKSGDRICLSARLRVKKPPHVWVGRGGVKLNAALEHYGFDVGGRICVDIGSSTGGFCDVLLSRGAARVYAVDVGRGQLHEKLRVSDKIISLEGVNARYLNATQLPEVPQIITCDVSFISLQKALGAVLQLTEQAQQSAHLIALIKPQFQLQKTDVGKGGIVKSASLHQKACDAVLRWLEQERGWHTLEPIPSPITGARGNCEFFIAATLLG